MKIKLGSWAYKPERAHADDAGLDIKDYPSSRSRRIP